MICQYVPPHVIDRLARCNHCAKTTSHESFRNRTARSAWFDAVSNPSASASRVIYDSEGTWDTRRVLARQEGDPASSRMEVNEAFDYAGKIRDFLKTWNWNGVDGQGSTMILNVRFGERFMNAFWTGSEIVLGEGDGQLFLEFGKSLDVLAHEMGHGVVQHTAALDYKGQAGALNEHFADVIGQCVQQWTSLADADNADWLIGNEIMGPALHGEALRSMKAPGTAYDHPNLGVDPQPAHARDYYHGPEDNFGVHINSGIFNRAFYLVAMAIGTQLAGRVWFQGLQNLWPAAGFEDAKEVLVEAARQLTPKTVPEGTVQTVRLAFRDVGL